jgi:hypothetical protein
MYRKCRSFHAASSGQTMIHFPKTFVFLSVWGERFSDGFQLGRKGMWLLTLRLFMAGKGEEGFRLNCKWKLTGMLGIVPDSLKKSLIA